MTSGSPGHKNTDIKRNLMKHNTHIYLAAKAIELIRQSIDNTRSEKGVYLKGGEKTKERRNATELQRIFQYYQELIEEATWAPDDILRDNDPFHIFKLFTDEEFPGHGLQEKQQFKSDGVVYYKFAGGLPFRVDHMAQEIINMSKLREYNDQFNLKQIMYQYLLISHYVADAHVPMHCDLRDDPPSKSKSSQPSRRSGKGKPEGKYMQPTAHNHLEQLWDDAVTPVAIREKIIARTWVKEKDQPTDLSAQVEFGFHDCQKGKDVKVRVIPKNGLMNFMINVCLQSKKRCQALFPLDSPETLNKEVLSPVTRDIFSDCIGNLVSVWRYIWVNSRGE